MQPNLPVRNTQMPTTSAATLARPAQTTGPVDGRLARCREIGALEQLIELAPNVQRWTTSLTIAAYRKGIDAGVDDAGAMKNPYSEIRSDYTRGNNNPWLAWMD